MKGIGWLLLGVVVANGARASSTSDRLRKLPLRFEESRGRDLHEGVRYLAHGSNFNLYLGETDNWLEWATPSSGTKMAVHTRMVGANLGVKVTPAQRLPGSANYFLGTRERSGAT